MIAEIFNSLFLMVLAEELTHIQKQIHVALCLILFLHKHLTAIRFAGLNIHPDIEGCLYYKVRFF